MIDAPDLEVLTEIFDDVLAMPLPDVDQELISSGLLDSMAIIALVVEIEDRFSVEIDAENLELASFATVRGMLEMVRRTQGHLP